MLGDTFETHGVGQEESKPEKTLLQFTGRQGHLAELQESPGRPQTSGVRSVRVSFRPPGPTADIDDDTGYCQLQSTMGCGSSHHVSESAIIPDHGCVPRLHCWQGAPIRLHTKGEIRRPFHS